MYPQRSLESPFEPQGPILGAHTSNLRITQTPKVCEIMACMAILMGLGLLSYILLGFRYWPIGSGFRVELFLGSPYMPSICLAGTPKKSLWNPPKPETTVQKHRAPRSGGVDPNHHPFVPLKYLYTFPLKPLTLNPKI